MIMPTTILANWAATENWKQEVTNETNKQENKHSISHEYHVGDKILIRKQIEKLGKLQCPTKGPFVIVEINDLTFNCTVIIDKGSNKEEINICCILHFSQQSSYGLKCHNTGITIPI